MRPQPPAVWYREGPTFVVSSILQAASICSGLPYTFFLCIMCTCLWRALDKHVNPEKAETPKWKFAMLDGIFDAIEFVFSLGSHCMFVPRQFNNPDLSYTQNTPLANFLLVSFCWEGGFQCWGAGGWQTTPLTVMCPGEGGGCYGGGGDNVEGDDFVRNFRL